MSWKCAGFGFGEIARAYALAAESGIPVAEIFGMKTAGMGWGNIVKEILPSRPDLKGTLNGTGAENFDDELKLKVVKAEPNITLLSNHRAMAAEKSGDAIAAIVVQSTLTSRRQRLAGRLFADCTGDAVIGYLAGADHEFSVGNNMGSTNLWRPLDASKEEDVLKCEAAVKRVAREFMNSQDFLFLGRGPMHPVALEGALKLKEISYIHAEGFAAGELKHGPIALIDAGQPVFIVVPSPDTPHGLHGKVVSNIQEIRARGARTLVIAEDGDEDVVPFADEVIRIPQSSPLLAPLLSVVPLQVFACELATAKGLDVDQPRNLAKSVTVE